MEDKKLNIKIRLTLYGWVAFRIYLPFIGALRLYDLQLNMFEDIQNNVGKYIVIKSVDVIDGSECNGEK